MALAILITAANAINNFNNHYQRGASVFYVQTVVQYMRKYK